MLFFGKRSAQMAVKIGDRFKKKHDSLHHPWVVSKIFNHGNNEHVDIVREAPPFEKKTISTSALLDKNFFSPLPSHDDR